MPRGASGQTTLLRFGGAFSGQTSIYDFEPATLPDAHPPTTHDMRTLSFATESHRQCPRCGEHLGQSYRRVWDEGDGVLGCPSCLPRSVRFGEDVYDRDPDDAQMRFDRAAPL